MGQPVGQLAQGFRADFVELKSDHPMLVGVDENDILDRYVFAGSKDMVASVYVAGQQWVRNGIHKMRDAAAARFSAVMEEFKQ